MADDVTAYRIIISVSVIVGMLGIVILSLWVAGVFSSDSTTVSPGHVEPYLPCVQLETFTEVAEFQDLATDFRFGHGLAVDDAARTAAVVSWGPPPATAAFPTLFVYSRDKDNSRYVRLAKSTWTAASWGFTPNVQVPYPPDLSFDGEAVLLGATKDSAVGYELRVLELQLAGSTLQPTAIIKSSTETLGDYKFLPGTHDFVLATLDGANDGTVHVYRQKLAQTWDELQTLDSPSTSASGFGEHVYTSLRTMVVVRSDGWVDPEFMEYHREGSSNRWQLKQTHTRPASSDPASFGASGSLSRDGLLLALGNSTNSTVYIYSRTVGTTFTLLHTLTRASSVGFGQTINFSGWVTLLVTGDLDAAQGKVFVYHVNRLSNNALTLHQTLTQTQMPGQSSTWGFGMNYTAMQDVDTETWRVLLPRTDLAQGGSVFVYEATCEV